MQYAWWSEMHSTFQLESLEERDHLKYLEVDGRVTLTWSQRNIVWGLDWADSGQRPVTDSFEHGTGASEGNFLMNWTTGTFSRRNLLYEVHNILLSFYYTFILVCLIHSTKIILKYLSGTGLRSYLNGKVAAPIYKTEINGRGDSLRWPRDILYPLKLALTSPTSGVRSVGIVRLWTKATEF
jgi:hypothetical protein